MQTYFPSIPTFLAISASALLSLSPSNAGSFPPAAGEPGSTAIPIDDSRIQRWVDTLVSYLPGEDVDPQWQNANNAIGPASVNTFDVVSLGRGGQITLSLQSPLIRQTGPEFAVFDNAFSPNFLELAYVEVSSDGENFVRFPTFSETPNLVGSFGVMDTTKVLGFAGKYQIGFGTPFDLDQLPPHPQLDLEQIRFIRIVDVIGNGSEVDSIGRPIFDPFPTFISAGFDLNGIAALDPIPLQLTISKSEQELLLRWRTQPGQHYVIKQSHNPAGPWLEVPNSLKEATDTTTELTIPTPASSPTFFIATPAPAQLIEK